MAAVPLFDRWRASGREVAVVGLGKSGVAAALLLRDHGVPTYASDIGTGPNFEAWAARLGEAGVTVHLGAHDLDRIARAIAVVVAPGVPPEAPPLEAARKAGLPVHAEIDIGFLALRGTRCIGITGTNGKTTTTSLISHVMVASGVRAETAGNIGRPRCDVARSASPPDWLALELSSFQLHDTPNLKPAVGVLTNLAPNHLDRYHSLEEYYGDKALLFRNARSESVWVTNADDPAVQEMAAGVAGSHRRFSIRTRADAWYDRERGQLMLGARPAPPVLGAGSGRRLVRPECSPAHAGLDGAAAAR